MSHRPIRRGFALTAVAIGITMMPTAATAQDPEVVQVDLSSVLNADLVVNTDGTTASGVDETNDSIDAGDRAYLTQAAAEELCVTDPVGLPNDGFFPAAAEHPDVQLSYSDGDNGDNTVLLNQPGASVTVPAGSHTFVELHTFLAATEGRANVTITLNYATGPAATQSVEVLDWFESPEGGFYSLVDGMDRLDAFPPPFECNDADDAALFGLALSPDPGRALVSVDFTLDAGEDSFLVLFGLTGIASAEEEPPPPEPPPATAAAVTPSFTG